MVHFSKKTFVTSCDHNRRKGGAVTLTSYSDILCLQAFVQRHFVNAIKGPVIIYGVRGLEEKWEGS